MGVDLHLILMNCRSESTASSFFLSFKMYFLVCKPALQRTVTALTDLLPLHTYIINKKYRGGKITQGSVSLQFCVPGLSCNGCASSIPLCCRVLQSTVSCPTSLCLLSSGFLVLILLIHLTAAFFSLLF